MTPELKQNFQIIAERFPEVIQELKTHAHTFADPAHTALYRKKVYGKAADSTIQRWLKAADTQELRITVTVGFGDGSHLERLLEVLPNSSRVCLIECDPSLFLGFLNQRDYSELLSNPRFILTTPFCYREIITRLNIEMIAVESAASFLYAPIYNLNPELHQNVVGMVMRQLTTRWNQVKTDVEHAEIVFENSLQNLQQIGFGSDISGFREMFKDHPFILVGAGPSLDDSLDFLRAIQGKAIIGVVNSAYRALHNAGITPDLTVAVDPKEGTFRGYKGLQVEQTPLFCTYLVYPEVPKLFGEWVVPLSSFNFLMDMVRKVMKLPPEPAIVGDGTVSSTVVNLAAFMGCDEIYLVGQDLAIRESGQVHASDSFYTDDQINQEHLANCVWVDSNHGKKVPVEAKLHAYLRIFENQVSGLSHIRFYNLSKLGARIHGCTFMEYADAQQKLCGKAIFSYAQLIRNKMDAVRIPGEALKAARWFFEKYYQFLQKTCGSLLRFAVAAEMDPSTHPLCFHESTFDAHPLHGMRNEILEQFNGHPLFTSLMVEGRTKTEYHHFVSSGEDWNLISNETASVGSVLPQVWALIEGSVFQMQCIERHLLSQNSAHT